MFPPQGFCCSEHSPLSAGGKPHTGRAGWACPPGCSSGTQIAAFPSPGATWNRSPPLALWSQPHQGCYGSPGPLCPHHLPETCCPQPALVHFKHNPVSLLSGLHLARAPKCSGNRAHAPATAHRALSPQPVPSLLCFRLCLLRVSVQSSPPGPPWLRLGLLTACPLARSASLCPSQAQQPLGGFASQPPPSRRDPGPPRANDQPPS